MYQLSMLWWRAQAHERKAPRSSTGRPPLKGEPTSARDSITKLWLLITERQFDDEFDLHGNVEGELGDADGAPSVGSSLAEDLAQNVRRAVYHLGLAVEAGGGGDVARDLYYSAHVL
jgi:hypothetical protein